MAVKVAISRIPRLAVAEAHCVYLNAFKNRSETRASINRWFAFHNSEHPHSAL